MDEKEQRIKISEACGWELKHSTQYDRNKWYSKDGRYVCDWNELPDYLSDLNSCHEMEKTLGFDDKVQFIIKLGGLCRAQDAYDWMDVAFATAPQRCEAYLKVKGLWK